MENLILLADAYKYSHHKLYVPGTSQIYSYLESRGGKFEETVFYGLQYFLKEYLQGPVFTREKINEAEHMLLEVFHQFIQQKSKGRKVPAWAKELREMIEDQLDTNLTL